MSRTDGTEKRQRVIATFSMYTSGELPNIFQIQNVKIVCVNNSISILIAGDKIEVQALEKTT